MGLSMLTHIPQACSPAFSLLFNSFFKWIHHGWNHGRFGGYLSFASRLGDQAFEWNSARALMASVLAINRLQ
jgi:hypothetical protein